MSRKVLGAVMVALIAVGGCSSPVNRDPASAPDAPNVQAEPTPAVLGNNEPIMMSPMATNASISITLSQAAYPDGAANTAILVRDDTWAYAIATGGVQGTLGGPLLLTPYQKLAPGIIDELRRVGAETVYILGDEATIMPAVAQELTEAGYTVERIGGGTHIQTSVAAASRLMPDAATAIVLGGMDQPSDPGRGAVDALAAGAWAAIHDYPVLLTDPFSLSPETADYIRQSAISRVVIIGGRVAVSEEVSAELERLGVEVERVGGENRFDTAAKIVERWGGAHRGYLLIDGNSERLWAAGFAAAAYSMRANAPVLLANSGTLPSETDAMLKSLRAPVQLVCAPGVADSPCMTAQDLAKAMAS